MEKYFYSQAEAERRAYQIALEIIASCDSKLNAIRIYGVPRGGIPVAFMVAGFIEDAQVVFDSTMADVIVDDLVDSGLTKSKYPSTIPFYVLYDKKERGDKRWVVFPWELSNGDHGVEEIVMRTLQYIGEDVTRSGIVETPKRVVKAWDAMFSGYKQDPGDIFKVFDEPCDEMVILRNIEFYSTCEHHMLPFFGKAHIAYIPNGKVVGISKLARLVDCFARRLQIQERMTQQITSAIEDYLKPQGVACIVEAKHLCMMARGVEKQNSVMITSSIKGVFKDNDSSRIEFLLLNGRGGL